MLSQRGAPGLIRKLVILCFECLERNLQYGRPTSVFRYSTSVRYGTVFRYIGTVFRAMLAGFQFGWHGSLSTNDYR